MRWLDGIPDLVAVSLSKLGGREFEQTLGLGDGQGGLACCSPRGHKDSDRKE